MKMENQVLQKKIVLEIIRMIGQIFLFCGLFEFCSGYPTFSVLLYMSFLHILCFCVSYFVYFIHFMPRMCIILLITTRLFVLSFNLCFILLYKFNQNVWPLSWKRKFSQLINIDSPVEDSSGFSENYGLRDLILNI